MKSKDRWTNSRTAVYNLGYHLIWCPKYRRKVLVGKVENRLKELMREKADELNITIEQMEVMPDHIHLFIKAKPTLSPHFIIQQFKSFSARKLRDEFPELKTKLPNMWTRSYFAESVGHISEETIKKYIEQQKNK